LLLSPQQIITPFPKKKKVGAAYFFPFPPNGRESDSGGTHCLYGVRHFARSSSIGTLSYSFHPVELYWYDGTGTAGCHNKISGQQESWLLYWEHCFLAHVLRHRTADGYFDVHGRLPICQAQPRAVSL